MSVMGAQQKQQYRNAEEEFLGWRVLGPVVDLFPHVQIVICSRVELKWHTTHPVEHEK